MGKLTATLAAMLVSAWAFCGTPVTRYDPEEKTCITPYWFGPNAFPVPYMSDGTVDGSLKLEVGARYDAGRLVPGGTDRTWSLPYRVSVPLFSDRVNLALWGELHEWWDMGPETVAARRLEGIDGTRNNCGEMWLSTDFILLRESGKMPAVTMRAALKSAAGWGYFNARYYDSPGYFFDADISKTFGRFRIAAECGFLCWQTDNGRQNDALKYALGASWHGKALSARAEIGGYHGHEHYHDAPLTARARADFRTGMFAPFIRYEYGIRDYPFSRFEAGVAWSINIIK